MRCSVFGCRAVARELEHDSAARRVRRARKGLVDDRGHGPESVCDFADVATLVDISDEGPAPNQMVLTLDAVAKFSADQAPPASLVSAREQSEN